MKFKKLIKNCLNHYYIIYSGSNKGTKYLVTDIPKKMLNAQVEEWWLGIQDGNVWLKIRLKENRLDDIKETSI